MLKKKNGSKFTDVELARIWLTEPGKTVESGMQAVLDYINANMADGIVVDWSKAPEWATSAVMVWSWQDAQWFTEFNRLPRPIITRPMNYTEKRIAIERKINTGMVWEFSQETIDMLCKDLEIYTDVVD